MDYPKISVVIGSFNRLPMLELCIDAVREELKDKRHEIVVVDGGSTDGTVDWLTGQKDIITIIQHNRGEWRGQTIARKPWAYFMNLAFKCASGEYICMLSDDSLIVPGAINNGMRLFDTRRKQGEKIGGVAFYFRDYPLRKDYAVAVNIGNLYVNHGLFLNAALNEVNYCDESYHFYFADTDLALKLKKAGYDILASEQSFVEHYFEATPEIRASNNDERKEQDRRRLIEKWCGISYPEVDREKYEKIVGYWQYHPRKIEDSHGTIEKLINATKKKDVEKLVLPQNNEVLTPDLWRDILYADLFFLKDKTYEEKVEIQKRWLDDFIKSEFHLPDVTETDVVFFRSMARDDYKALFHSVIEASGITDRVVVEDYNVCSKPSHINPKTSRYLMENYRLVKQLDIADPMDRACCAIRLAMYKYVLDHFRKMRFRALVCFADMQPVEHLLARYFRAQGITTVTMQHGLYVDYGNMDTVNVINYLHQPSEYFLSWGPDTSQLIARHHPNTKIVECGKPLIFNAAPPNKPSDEPYIALLLDQKPFHTQNEEMIKIVRSYALREGFSLRVRFHPSLPKREILNKYPDLTEQLHFTDAEFVVGHTSSLIYEALALGCRVLRYRTKIPAIPLPDNSQFATLKELESCLVFPQREDLWKRYFKAVGINALGNYRSFFDGLLRSESRVANCIGADN